MIGSAAVQLCPDGDPKVIRLLSEGFLAGVKGDLRDQACNTLGQPRFCLRWKQVPPTEAWKVERPTKRCSYPGGYPIAIQWLFEKLTASFRSYSYYPRFQIKCNLELRLQPGKIPVISQMAAETELKAIVSYRATAHPKSYGSSWATAYLDPIWSTQRDSGYQPDGCWGWIVCDCLLWATA